MQTPIDLTGGMLGLLLITLTASVGSPPEDECAESLLSSPQPELEMPDGAAWLQSPATLFGAEAGQAPAADRVAWLQDRATLFLSGASRGLRSVPPAWAEWELAPVGAQAVDRQSSILGSDRVIQLEDSSTEDRPRAGLRVPVWVRGVGGAGLLLGSAAAGVATGLLIPSLRFQAVGRPDPLALSAGLGVGLLTGTLISQVLVPLVAGELSTLARVEAFRTSRWALLAALMGVGLVTTGALLERGSFGNGQVWIGVGGTVLLVSTIVYGVLELRGVLKVAARN